MVTITCTKCGGPHEAKSKRVKYCDPCRTPAEHKNSTRNILARKAKADEKRERRLREQAAVNAVTATKRRTMPFFDDAEELDWLIKEQQADANSYRVNRIYLDTVNDHDSWARDDSFEESLDALCETW